IQPLGWSLVHFLWQGAVVALLLAGYLRLLRPRSANARYLTACAALPVMAACPGLTWLGTHAAQSRDRSEASLPGRAASAGCASGAVLGPAGSTLHGGLA